MRTSLISSLIGGAAALAAQPAAADPYSLCWSDGQHLTCGRVDPLVPPIDRVTEVVPHASIRGYKCVSFNEPWFPGHFPQRPIMPGVLQLEAMAQVASIVLLRMPGNQGKIGYFMSADNVKWRRPVLPGDTLIIETEILKRDFSKRVFPAINLQHNPVRTLREDNSLLE